MNKHKAPAFFMFFLAENSSIDMRIPVAFIRIMGQALPERVFLRDRHDNLWTVKVAKVGDFWYFVDGWDKFVVDNSLITGDLMVFEYYSDLLFHVKVYGPSATEKTLVGPSGTEKIVVGPSIFARVEKEEPVSEHYDIEYDCDQDEEAESENYDHNISMRKDHDNEANDDNNDDDDDDEETDICDYTLLRRLEPPREVVPGQLNNDVAVVGRNTQKKLVYLYRKCYGMEIFEAGLAKQPKSPYFVAKIMPKRKSDLFIPTDLIKDNQLNLGNEVHLIDPTGREFRAKCRQWKDGRSILSGGWRRLCRVNFVTLEDSCICEFVRREGDPRQFLYVSFVRADVIENLKNARRRSLRLFSQRKQGQLRKQKE